MAKSEIPYATSLPKVRRMLEASVHGADLETVGAELGLEERFIDYNAAAIEALGLGKRRAGALQLSRLGRDLIHTQAHSAAEAAVFRRATEGSKAIMRAVPSLLAPVGPKKDELVRRLRAAGLAPSTAEQRAAGLLRWRTYVLKNEQQLPLSSPMIPDPGVRYNGRAMLRALRIYSFKAFGESKRSSTKAASELSLSPLTVLAGPNGAGKSTILQALDVLGFLVRGNITEMLKAHEWDYSDLPHLRSPRQSVTLEVDLEVGDSVLRWRLTLATRKHPGIAAESVRARGRDDAAWRDLLVREGRKIEVVNESSGQVEKLPLVTHPQSWLSTLDERDDAARVPGLLAVKAWAERIHAFWSLNPSTLRAPSRGAAHRIGSRGEDLASFLYGLQRHEPKRFEAFLRRVRRHYPRLVRIEARRGEFGWKRLEITERWNHEQATFNAHQVSDGLLRLMVVASLPEWREPPSLVLIDEVENGMHPRLLAGVAELLSELSSSVQVVATTHSPITLNYVPDEMSRLVTRGKGGVVTVTPLTDTKNYDRLREQFEPGELWYNVGEERLTSKRAR